MTNEPVEDKQPATPSPVASKFNTRQLKRIFNNCAEQQLKHATRDNLIQQGYSKEEASIIADL